MGLITEKTEADVVIIGAGMAGCGAAAYFAENSSLKVIIIEKQERIGGTAVAAGVNCFEPGVAAGKYHWRLSENLLKQGQASVQKSVEGLPNGSTGELWGLSVPCEDDYTKTLRRSGLPPHQWRRFMFDDTAMENELYTLIAKGNVSVLNGAEFLDCAVENGSIKSVTAAVRGKKVKVSAKYFIDSSGDIVLAQKSGCKTTDMAESRDTYGETGAPNEPQKKINGISFVFRLSNHSPELANPFTEYDEDVISWLKNALAHGLCSQINRYPNGDWNVNMLPTMVGEEFFSMDREKAKNICIQRVFCYSEYLMKQETFQGYRISHIFKLPGIRESRRLVGKYVLNQNDLIVRYQDHPMYERFVSIADHPMDIHARGGGCFGNITEPYGIPYDCLLPNEINNLLVSCRGASFSHLAASSCRLSRTMLSLGEASAMAIVQAIHRNISLNEVNPKHIFNENMSCFDLTIK